MAHIFEIFYRFFLLGWASFGGPVAHLGYFRHTFVEKLGWLDEATYARFVALSQFLPGPSSSQVGFTVGLHRGGIAGGIAAFVAFTLPSFLLLYFIAMADVSAFDQSIIAGFIAGLKLFAVVVVADAVVAMFKSFCKERLTIAIMIASTAVLVLLHHPWMQMAVLFFAALSGLFWARQNIPPSQNTPSKKSGRVWLLLFVALFAVLFLGRWHELFQLFGAFYETGALVFGGGHVVLPLLEQNLGTMIAHEEFLVGYALAQAVPGPMFSIAAFLGAKITAETPMLGALTATVALFLPGFLLVLAFKERFERDAKHPIVFRALIGVNAAVVGLLAAVLLDTVVPSAVHGAWDVAMALGGWVLLRRVKMPVYGLIALFMLAGWLFL